MDFTELVSENWIGRQTYYKPEDDYIELQNLLRNYLEGSYNKVIDLINAVSFCRTECAIESNMYVQDFLSKYVDYYTIMEQFFNSIYINIKQTGVKEVSLGYYPIYSVEQTTDQEELLVNIDFDKYSNYTTSLYQEYELKLRNYQKAIKDVLEKYVQLEFTNPDDITNFEKDSTTL